MKEGMDVPLTGPSVDSQVFVSSSKRSLREFSVEGGVRGEEVEFADWYRR